MPSLGVLDGEAETQSLLTEASVIVGTVPYMSPEQVKGEALDARSDIFSFGTVLYEMISGHRPFSAKTMAEIISAILTSEPPPLAHYSIAGAGRARAYFAQMPGEGSRAALPDDARSGD